MTKKKDITKKELDDIISFIIWCTKTNKDEGYILLNVLHDLVGISNREHGFLPRTDGYTKILNDLQKGDTDGRK